MVIRGEETCALTGAGAKGTLFQAARGPSHTGLQDTLPKNGAHANTDVSKV